MNKVSIIVTITVTNIAIIMNKREDRKMDNIILFESKDGYCYGVYNLETQTLFDCKGKEINDMNDVLHGGYTYLRWNKQYKQICIDGCSANGFDTVSIPNTNDTIIAYDVDKAYSIIIEFV